MKFPVSPDIEAVRFPPISEVKGWLEGREFPAERPLIDLCQAIPDYPPPVEMTEHLKPLLDDPAVCRYTPDEGLPAVREAVCAWYRRRYNAAPHPEQLCLSIGASQAFWLAMMVLCRQGDEVVVQLPAYFDHPMGLCAMGVRPIYAPFDEGNGGLPDIEKIASLVTPRTRAILLVTPSNPTGAVIPPAVIRQLFELAKEHRIALVLDETYNAFVEGPPHHLFADSDWPEHLVQVASFGKTFSLTGFRAGALVASERFIHQALKVQDSMAVCQPAITQHAVRYGCDHLDDWVAENAVMMRRRHDLFRFLFTAAGNRFELAASGSFFAWVRHPWPQLSGRQAARRILDEASVISLPGEAFGPGLDNYLRLAFGNITEEQIPQAVARFRSVSA